MYGLFTYISEAIYAENVYKTCINCIYNFVTIFYVDNNYIIQFLI
jgi:hypothetical protein